MRIHLVGLPHTETTREYLTCAYTQKVVKFCDMMTAGGHDVFLYAGARNEAACVEHVPVVTAEERVGWFGEWDPNGLFGNIDWDPSSVWWRTMNARTIAAILERAEPRDFLLLSSGWTQHPIAEALPELLALEPFVGYSGIRLEHRVFESYAWMHHVYGLRGIENGVAYDAVIPNFFDPADFQPSDDRDDYLLFIGRLVGRKGPQVAATIAGMTGRTLVVAGPGGRQVDEQTIASPELKLQGPHLEYVGPVGRERRAELMARAAAVIVPTLYIEPFGGVAVEAMLSGTPVVATDWGSFPEIVEEGVTGYRFRIHREGVAAVERAVELDATRIRERALERFSLDAVRPIFERHLERLSTLWGDGWYAV